MLRETHRLIDSLRSGKIDRRQFLMKAGLLGLSLSAIQAILAACGGGGLSDDPSDDEPEATDPPSDGSSPTSTAAPDGDADETPGSGDSGDSVPADVTAGGELTIGSIQEPDSLMPYFSFLVVSEDVINMMFDKLIQLNDELEYVTGIATEVPSVENGGISEDGLTITFKLRDDVTWHDGEPFTSADCKFTWETVMHPEWTVQTRAGWDNIDSVETPDDYTVVYHLKSVDSTILQYFAEDGWMLPKHHLENENLNESNFRRGPMGNGPFMFDEWQSGDYIRVVKNPNYWDLGKPYLDSVIYRTIPNTQGLLAALERREVQMRLAMNFTDQEKVREFDGFQVVGTPAYSYFNFRNQCEMPIINEKLVRQALMYAVDRETICATLLKGLVTPLHSLIMPTSWAYNENIEPIYEYDPDRAMELLDEAGWVLPSGSEVREKDGERLSFEIVNIAGDIERLQVVQAVQQYWTAIGVETEIAPIDAANFGATMDEGYTVAYNWTGHDHELTLSPWLREPNWPHFNNPRMYELIELSNSTIDRAQRTEFLHELQNIWAEEVPEMPMFQRILFDAVADQVQNYKPSAGNASTWNIEEWWLKE